jgi:uncharacterized membrane protein
MSNERLEKDTLRESKRIFPFVPQWILSCGGIHMSDVPIQVVVAAFTDEMAANQELQQLNQLQKEKTIKIVDVAALQRDERGNLHINEPSDWGWRKGAVAGGIVGAAVGLIAGPVGWATLGGAAIGGLAAKLRDSGFNDSELRRLGEGLTPGTSALVTLIEPMWVKQVEEELTKADAAILIQSISADMARALRGGEDLGNTAFSAEDASGAERMESEAGENAPAARAPEQPTSADQPPSPMSG